MISTSAVDCETAYAKINLALHVRSRQPDGYHHLETLFVFADDGDRLEARLADGLTLRIFGPFAEGLETEGNLVLRAAERLRADFGVRIGAAIDLDKRLPVASGIGGGSADAAAALRLLSRLWDLPADENALRDIARSLGADIPACVSSVAVRGSGRGDILEPLDAHGLRGVPILLVNPRIPLGTGAVFHAWDLVDRGALSIGDPLTVALDGRNDLEIPANHLLPVIGDVVALLRQQSGIRLARMSGSGATCFALFETIGDRDAADRHIASVRPDWWRLVSRLR